MSLAFYAEAKRILQQEKDYDNFLAVAALQVMTHACSGNGLDVEGGDYLRQCREMAERLGLQDESLCTPLRSQHLQAAPVDDALRNRAHVGQYSPNDVILENWSRIHDILKARMDCMLTFA